MDLDMTPARADRDSGRVRPGRTACRPAVPPPATAVAHGGAQLCSAHRNAEPRLAALRRHPVTATTEEGDAGGRLAQPPTQRTVERSRT
jgi:hypothetical protein